MTRKIISSNMEANMYMIMGLFLVGITFLWITEPLIPDILFVLVAIMGIVPVIIMMKGNFIQNFTVFTL